MGQNYGVHCYERLNDATNMPTALPAVLALYMGRGSELTRLRWLHQESYGNVPAPQAYSDSPAKQDLIGSCGLSFS